MGFLSLQSAGVLRNFRCTYYSFNPLSNAFVSCCVEKLLLHPQTPLLKYPFIYYHSIGLPSGLFLSCFHSKMLSAFQISAMFAVFPPIDLVTLKMFAEQKVRSMIYIDYRKAFDSIPHSYLLEILLIYKMDPVLINFMQKAMERWTTALHISDGIQQSNRKK
jgi:hypothetical protein